MHEPNIYKIFTEKFNELNIPYMITGSVASIIYGEPRMTHDIDLVVVISPNNIEQLVNLFPSDKFYLPPLEVLKNEIMRDKRGHCNIIHHETGFRADIYFAGKDEFQHWAIENIKKITFQADELPIAPPEYVIIKKLEFYKEGKSTKHLDDIKGIIRNSQEFINYDILKIYLAQFELENEWELINN